MSTPAQLNVCQKSCITVTIKNSCCDLVPIKDIKVESEDTNIVQIGSISSPNFTLVGISPGTTKICVVAILENGDLQYCLPVIVVPDDIKNYTMQLTKYQCDLPKCSPRSTE